MQIIDKVIDIALGAGKLLREMESGKEVYAKASGDDRHDIVTSVDIAVEKYVVEKLSGSFPDYQIFTEETDFSDITSEYFWAIDPIDGTKNFAAGIPFVGVSIGLLHKDIPILGVILNPYNEDVYHAERGKGAFKNGSQIHVAETSKLSDAMLVLEGKQMMLRKREYPRRFSTDARTLRNFGAATLNLAFICEGRLEGYIDEDLKYYDIAAGAVILEEAGGRMTDTKNKPVFPRRPGFDDIEVVVSNGLLHDVLIEYVSKG